MGVINLFRNYYKALRCSRMGKDRLFEVQQQRFRRLLRHTVRQSEFYQELYRGIDTEKCQLSDLPVVTKSAMMGNFDRFVCDKRLKLHEVQSWLNDKNNDGKLYLSKFIPVLTSGSTGENALVIYERSAMDWVQATMYARLPDETTVPANLRAKLLLAQILGASVRIAFLVVPNGNVHALFKCMPSFSRLFIKCKLLSLFDPLEQIVEELNEFQPDLLIAYSSYIGILAAEQLAGRLNIALDHPMSFLVGCSEPLTENVKKLSFKAWGHRIKDVYATAECCFMAGSCDASGHMHAMSDLCILEMVDHEYNSVPPGQYGEKILLTNLFNFVQPMIRYEIEDVSGYADKSCECGVPFPTLLSVQGRSTDFFYFEKLQGGYEKFHPYLLVVPLFYVYDLRQYQIVQTERNKLTFFYVPHKEGLKIEQQLSQTLQEALEQAGLESRVTLKIKRVESISRNQKSGKFQIMQSLGPPTEMDTVRGR